MDPSIRAAATGMMAQQVRTQVIANNLANVNTTGFKRSRAHFEDLLYQTAQSAQGVQESGADTVPVIQVGRGTRLATVQRVDIQGAVEMTGRPLDLAIEGEGFFQVRLPNGTLAYTRDGSLSISDQGVLVTHGGYEVVPGVDIPDDATELGVSRTGIVTGRTPGTGEQDELGRVELARFTNSAGLRALGENLYQETEASGEPVIGFPQDEGFGRIIQGSLESSNVEIVQEMVDMITALRAYEINSKAVQTGEQLAEIANNLVR
jgi:flagellar basal-body rod protein FlgG